MSTKPTCRHEGDTRSSYPALLAGPLLLLLLIGGLGLREWRRLRDLPELEPGLLAASSKSDPKLETPGVEPDSAILFAGPPVSSRSQEAGETQETVLDPTPEAPAEIGSDTRALAMADAEVFGAGLASEGARVRVDDAVRGLQAARLELQEIEDEGSTALASDPSVWDSQHREAVARGEFASSEIARVVGELAAIAQEPKPRRKSLVDRTPVARVPDGEEFHFELKGNRISPIDLEKLLDRVRVDARIQLRMADQIGSVRGLVGPVGAFSIRYELEAEGLDRGGTSLAVNYGLRGWELVPASEVRGETLSEAFQPASDFARSLAVLNPGRDSLTFWVYPDSFALFRRLRDVLTPRGFLVAGRPLPADMAIRGSPSGSVSAGQ